MPYKWTPPPGYASFELNGKLYYPGEMVPISKAMALHHMANSAHVFEGVMDDEPELPTPSGLPAVPEPVAPKA